MIKKKVFLLPLCALAVALALLQQPSSAAAADPSYTQTVQLKSGKVRGLVVDAGDQKKVEFFQAIRYGTAARFEKPHPVAAWSDTYNATQQRNACPQFGNQLDASMKNVSISEDCLFLNLYRPVEAKANRVMVWIHGGAFELGSIFSFIYNGQHFATEEDVIFVSIAYRLGPLGFITGGDVPPNLGLHDQVLALKWVQENIAAFGGDPSKVTIFGESAGGMSVSLLVLSPLAKGLFHRAIAQSGSALSFSTSLNSSFEQTKKFAKKVNCTVDAGLKETMKCIKGKTPAQLLPATLNDLATNDLFLPVFGDELLPLRPKVALEAGQVNHVDYIYGVTRDEGTLFAPMLFPELGKEGGTNLTVQTAKGYITRIMALYGLASHGKEIADYYVDKLHSTASQDDFKLAISAVWGDLNIVCPSVIFGEELTRQLPMTSHVYAYRLMQVAPMGDLGFPTYKWMGVSHGQDIFYLFLPQLAKNIPAAHQLSHRMIEDWTTFAKVGHPQNALWRESFHRETNDFNTRYIHLEVGHFRLVSGHFKETCEKIWKPIIFT